jgi:DNA invertase Pin-like site-specific DNA recombinase
MPAFAYYRKSSVHDPERDTSYQTQERETQELAAFHKDTIERVLVDWNVSGRRESLSKRKAYAALIAAIESGECTAVYSYSLSRLGRSVSQLSALFDLCKDKSVPIRLRKDAIDTSSASGRMTATILSAVSEFEAEVAAERINDSFATRRARARAAGTSESEAVRSRHRYGEKASEDAAAVLAAYQEAGGNFGAAARLLNERGVLPRDGHEGKRWWSSSVREVVRRLDPTVAALPNRRGMRSTEGFALSKLLRCPTCAEHGDTRYLTGSRLRAKDGTVRARYACRAGESWPHPKVAINEARIMPAIVAEADLLDTGYTHGESFASDARERAEIASERRTVRDMTQAGVTSLADAQERIAALAAREAKLDQRRALIDLPDSIVWGASLRAVNAQLRALWEYVELDVETFQPTHFEWAMPELRRPALRVVG